MEDCASSEGDDDDDDSSVKKRRAVRKYSAKAIVDAIGGHGERRIRQDRYFGPEASSP